MRVILFASLFFLLLTACTKKQSTEVEGNGELQGRWVLTEKFMSPGSGGSWNGVPFAEQSVIEFTPDGRFKYSSNFDKAAKLFDRYTLSGTTVTMSSTANSNTEEWYIHHLDRQRMDISIFMCFEGCAYRFKPAP